MFSCAAEKGIDFCVDCEEYPCDDLKQFQSKRVHRIELWDDLEQIRVMGYEHWLQNICENYTCPQCQTLNSAYDLKCRKCGRNPSCEYVAKHRLAIEKALKNM
jgi:ribosomal protein L40E